MSELAPQGVVRDSRELLLLCCYLNGCWEWRKYTEVRSSGHCDRKVMR